MLDSRKGLLGEVGFPPELLTWKINICPAQGKKRHFKDYYRTNISHQEDLFKKSYSICLVYHWKGYDYYFMGVQRGAVNFLGSNICWSDGKA